MVNTMKKKTPVPQSKLSTKSAERDQRLAKRHANLLAKQEEELEEIIKGTVKQEKTTVKEERKSSVLGKRAIKKTKKSKKVEYIITTNTLRPRNNMKFIWRKNKDRDEDDDSNEEGNDDDDDDDFDTYGEKRRRRKKMKRGTSERRSSKREYTIEDFEDVYEDASTVQDHIIEEALNKIPKNKKELKKLYEKVTDKVGYYKELFKKEQFELKGTVHSF